MKTYLMLEITSEVSWILGDKLKNAPRAESRWRICDISQDIINSGIIDDTTEDIDEVIEAYLIERGLK
jgi:hypothetical protein